MEGGVDAGGARRRLRRARARTPSAAVGFIPASRLVSILADAAPIAATSEDMRRASAGIDLLIARVASIFSQR